MAWKWAHYGTKHGFNWGAVRRSGTEAFFNVPYVPQGGWTVPDDTVGLAFTMFTRVDDQLGFDYPETVAVAYVMEYTFPIAKCNMAASWDTRLSITLPRGICVTNAGNPSSCTSNDTVYADFQMFTVQDPSGTMGGTGAGRTALEDDHGGDGGTRQHGPSPIFLIRILRAAIRRLRRSRETSTYPKTFERKSLLGCRRC